jgi:hypothetical protein
MSLNFLPRKLQQRATKQTPESPNKGGPYGKEEPARTAQLFKGKRKVSSDDFSDEAILVSLRLAFSDYNLQHDNEFRELLSSVDEDECSFILSLVIRPALTSNLDIPLHRILKHNTLLLPAKTVGEAHLVRLIKSHSSDIEIRLRLSEPSTSHFDGAGGFEIRCTKWRRFLTRQWDDSFWEERTVYIVCLLSSSLKVCNHLRLQSSFRRTYLITFVRSRPSTSSWYPLPQNDRI